MQNKQVIKLTHRRLELKSCDKFSELYNGHKYTLFASMVKDICKILNCSQNDMQTLLKTPLESQTEQSHDNTHQNIEEEQRLLSQIARKQQSLLTYIHFLVLALNGTLSNQTIKDTVSPELLEDNDIAKIKLLWHLIIFDIVFNTLGQYKLNELTTEQLQYVTTRLKKIKETSKETYEQAQTQTNIAELLRDFIIAMLKLKKSIDNIELATGSDDEKSLQ